MLVCVFLMDIIVVYILVMSKYIFLRYVLKKKLKFIWVLVWIGYISIN